MRKILLVLLFVVCVFAGEVSVPKGVGDVDGAVYTTDKKTLYTLQNETVTKWSVNPLKKLDSFETTVNHLRNYVAEDIDNRYLEGLTKNEKFIPLVLNEKDNILTVSSEYISEIWNLKNKQLSFGGLKNIEKVTVIFNQDNKKSSMNHFINVFNYNFQAIETIEVSIDNKNAYQVYFNPKIQWAKHKTFSLITTLVEEALPKKECEVVLTMIDGISLTYNFKLQNERSQPDKKTKIQKISTRVFLEKSQIDDPHEEVWKTTNASKAMQAMYKITKSHSFQPSEYSTRINGLGYSMKAIYGLDFDSILICNSLEKNDVLYPTMILNSNTLDIKSGLMFTLNGHQLHQWNHGYIEDIGFTLIGQTKDKKVYQWNVVVPGKPGDN